MTQKNLLDYTITFCDKTETLHDFLNCAKDNENNLFPN